MAISKKGLRKIVVEYDVFYWRFNEKVFVNSEKYKNSLLIVDFGWHVVWLYVNDKENQLPDFEPKSVTPKFVRESIFFALSKKWKEGKMGIEFTNGNYQVKTI